MALWEKWSLHQSILNLTDLCRLLDNKTGDVNNANKAKFFRLTNFCLVSVWFKCSTFVEFQAEVLTKLTKVVLQLTASKIVLNFISKIVHAIVNSLLSDIVTEIVQNYSWKWLQDRPDNENYRLMSLHKLHKLIERCWW